jgi:putative ABC transport system permease protein
MLNRKLRRDIVNTRAMLFSILLVSTVGVATFVGMTSVFANLLRARDDYYAASRMAEFWIDLKKAPDSEIEQIRAVPGVSEAQGRIVFQATVDLPGVIRPLNATVLSLPDDPAPGITINDIVLQRGSTFSAHDPNEVIVNDAFAKAHDLSPGDDISVILNNRKQPLRIVGTALSAEFAYLLSPGGIIPDPETFGVLYIKRTFAEDVLDFDGACNQIIGLLTPESATAPDVTLDRLERLLEPHGVFATTPLRLQSSHQILSDELAELRISAIVLPVVFLLVAALVLNILMSRLIEQQRVTIGTLKALGVSDGALMGHYFSYSVVVGVLGGLAGALLGYWLAAGMTILYRQYFEFPNLTNRPIVSSCLAGLAISLGFSLMGALRGAHAVVRLSPAEAMRAMPSTEGGAIALEQFRALWGALGFRWRMAIRSIWRHRWRTAAGVFAASMGAALLFTTFYFLSSMNRLINHEFRLVLASDIDVSFTDEQTEGALLEAERLPGVTLAEPLLGVACHFTNGHRSRRSAVIGVDPGAMLTVPRDNRGAPLPIPSDGLLMSQHLANLLGVGVGDTVTLRPIKGVRTDHRVQIRAIASGFLGMATYSDRAWLNELVGEESSLSTVQLQVEPSIEARNALYRELKERPVVQSVVDNDHAREKLQTTLLDALRMSISLLIGMAGVIFLGSILTMSRIAMSERKREIATMRVLGFTQEQVGGVFLRESLLVNFAGGLLGMPLGLWLSISLIQAHSREAYRLPIVLSPTAYIVTITLTLIFTLAAHFLVQRAIERLDWIDALNARE